MDKEFGHGFDNACCEGCEHHEEKSMLGATYKACGLCGCPTRDGFPMDKLDAPPSDCPRLDCHKKDR